MKLMIIGAMHKEIVYILSKLKDYKEEKKGGFLFYNGSLGKHQVILTESGIGKVMAGVLISAINSNYSDLDYIISVGVAGGINGSKILDVYAIDKMVYGDVDMRADGVCKFGQIEGFPDVYYGDNKLLNILKDENYQIADICTSDCFITNELKAMKLINDYFPNLNIKAMDMETTAFAQVCKHFDLKYIAIKAISDVIGGSNQVIDYFEVVNKACVVSSEAVINLILKLE